MKEHKSMTYTLDSKQTRNGLIGRVVCSIERLGSNVSFPFLLETVKPCREHISDGHVEPGTRVYIVRDVYYGDIYFSHPSRNCDARGSLA